MDGYWRQNITSSLIIMLCIPPPHTYEFEKQYLNIWSTAQLCSLWKAKGISKFHDLQGADRTTKIHYFYNFVVFFFLQYLYLCDFQRVIRVQEHPYRRWNSYTWSIVKDTGKILGSLYCTRKQLISPAIIYRYKSQIIPKLNY